MIKYFIILLLAILQSNDNPRFADREFIINGSLNSAVEFENQNLKLVQIDAINDSLFLLVNSAVPNLELLAGPASYHRIINDHQYERLFLALHILEKVSNNFG